MDPRKVLSFLLASNFTFLAYGDSSPPKEQDFIKKKSDSSRYADRYSDAYVSDAWERSADGWVRGGYTLMSGDSKTNVEYTVDPLGEMQVMIRKPGQQSAQTTYRIDRPLNGYRVPIFKRLHHFHDDDEDEDEDEDEHLYEDTSFEEASDFADFPKEWRKLSKIRCGLKRGGNTGRDSSI